MNSSELSISNHSTSRPRPIALIILDGWGYREDPTNNAISKAYKPTWDYLWKNYPHTLINGCGNEVGLPEGQMGNSEVGHLNIGAGRIVYQDLTRINHDIETGEFFKNPTLNESMNTQGAIHILGLISEGGVHSHVDHILALIQLAKQKNLKKVYVHAFLDGRDTPPKSAENSLKAVSDALQTLGNEAHIVSIIGRYYAMDRDKRWERVQKAFELITEGRADYEASDPLSALKAAYERGETDEFVKATRVNPFNPIQDGDSVIFMNYRADRARELTRALVDPNFTGFVRNKTLKISVFTTLTEYDKTLYQETLNTKIAFPPQTLNNILPEYLSTLNFKQLRIAETEKYAHITFFFNGGREEPYPGEDRILIPSPKVATYDLKPEMSAFEVTDCLVDEIKSKKYDLIVCNFANPDMVGHSGNFKAAVTAIEVIDQCLQKIINALAEVQGEALITADHGNAEIMFDEITKQPHTAHTNELIPLIYYGRKAKFVTKDGILADIAPTILHLMNISKPTEMTGQVLLSIL